MVTIRLPMILILVCSLFLSFSCNNSDNVTSSEINHDLFKPMDIYGINSNTPHPYVHTSNFWESIEIILTKLTERLTGEQWEICFFFASGFIPSPSLSIESDNIEDAYNFRDNFLRKSNKGNDYIISYYLLSQYGITNNLVTKYPHEHMALLKDGINISLELQNSRYDNKIIISYSDYENIKNITNIYRKSENHTKIEPILDYLEADLNKYLNKSKAEILADFKN